MKPKKTIKIIGSVCLIIISILGYSNLFGNPISYMKARKEISSYIEENYNNKLSIEEINYSSKFNGYSAIVSHIKDGNEKSYITYHNTGYINDGYEFEVRLNMEEKVRTILEALIIQGTNLTIENIGVEPSIELPQGKYNLNERYSGKEPIDLEVWLHPNYGNAEDGKDKNYNYEQVLYKNEDEFASGAYEIIKVLKGTKFNFNSVEIYSYKEDGNTSYRVKLDNGDIGKSLNNIKDKVYVKASEK